MNNSYYNPMFPGASMPAGTPNQQTAPAIDQGEEQSYIENILRFNRGKMVKVHMTFPDSAEWRDRIFTGVLEHAGRDNIVVSEPSTGKWYLLLKIYLDYVEFDEPIIFTPGISKPGPGR